MTVLFKLSHNNNYYILTYSVTPFKQGYLVKDDMPSHSKGTVVNT